MLVHTEPFEAVLERQEDFLQSQLLARAAKNSKLRQCWDGLSRAFAGRRVREGTETDFLVRAKPKQTPDVFVTGWDESIIAGHYAWKRILVSVVLVGEGSRSGGMTVHVVGYGCTRIDIGRRVGHVALIQKWYPVWRERMADKWVWMCLRKVMRMHLRIGNHTNTDMRHTDSVV